MTTQLSWFGKSLKEHVAGLGKKEAVDLLHSEPRSKWLRVIGFGETELGSAKNMIRARLNDFIATTPEAVDALVKSRFRPLLGRVLDPFAGDGAILRRLIDHGWKREDLFACEIRGEEEAALCEMAGDVKIGDWYQVRLIGRSACPECSERTHKADVPCGCCGHYDGSCGGINARDGIKWRGWPSTTVITNVPFGQIPEAPLSCLSPDLSGELQYVAILMPVEELSGIRRCTWIADHPPTGLLNLTWRPFPNVRGVAWYIWQRGENPLNMEWI